jgi:8-oxo-dGTP pyrophosphatase MutT (NUDIX family)
VRPQLPHLLASAVVLDAPRRHVLLLRETDRPRWGLPAGHAQGGERLAEAARREVREQTGLGRFTVVEPHLALQQDLVDCHGSQVRHVEHVFLVTVDPAQSVQPGPLDRDGSAAWFGVRDLPALLTPGVSLHLSAALRSSVDP